jgi:tRNA nucleotidyltransferase (CCA-adding enzyme)
MYKEKFQKEIPSYVNRAADILIKNGYSATLVGGAVRDIIIGRRPKDYDLATNALPEDIIRIFSKTVNTNAHFGTIIVIIDDNYGENFDIEITTYRKEEEYRAGRWPTKVEFSSDLVADLERRDFTINAIAIDINKLYDPTSIDEEIVVDPFNGLLDIKNKIVRAVGNPIDRFSEDGIRPYKACRIAAELNYEINKETFDAIKVCINIASMISAERIRDEFLKLIKYSKKPSIGIEYLRKSGLLNIFLPELLENFGIFQPEWHSEDVYYHSLSAMDIADDSIKLAALLHDIGKARTMTVDDKGTHFFGHDKVGAEMVKTILERLKFSKLETNRIVKLVRWHMFYYPSADWRKTNPEKNMLEIEDQKSFGGWSDAAVRRFIKNVGGEDLIDQLIMLRLADAGSNKKTNFDQNEIMALQKRIAKIREQDMALKISDLKVTGKDLIELGVEEGPIMGNILKYLLDLVIDDPLLNNKDILINIINNKFLKK